MDDKEHKLVVFVATKMENVVEQNFCYQRGWEEGNLLKDYWVNWKLHSNFMYMSPLFSLILALLSHFWFYLHLLTPSTWEQQESIVQRGSQDEQNGWKVVSPFEVLAFFSHCTTAFLDIRREEWFLEWNQYHDIVLITDMLLSGSFLIC